MIAKADAWFTTCILMINLPDGKGGKRNNIFQETTFSTLLPMALLNLTSSIRALAIISHFPSEINKFHREITSATIKKSDWFKYSFRTEDRKAADVVYIPSKKTITFM